MKHDGIYAWTEPILQKPGSSTWNGRTAGNEPYSAVLSRSRTGPPAERTVSTKQFQQAKGTENPGVPENATACEPMTPISSQVDWWDVLQLEQWPGDPGVGVSWSCYTLGNISHWMTSNSGRQNQNHLAKSQRRQNHLALPHGPNWFSDSPCLPPTARSPGQSLPVKWPFHFFQTIFGASSKQRLRAVWHRIVQNHQL